MLSQTRSSESTTMILRKGETGGIRRALVRILYTWHAIQRSRHVAKNGTCNTKEEYTTQREVKRFNSKVQRENYIVFG